MCGVRVQFFFNFISTIQISHVLESTVRTVIWKSSVCEYICKIRGVQVQFFYTQIYIYVFIYI